MKIVYVKEGRIAIAPSTPDGVFPKNHVMRTVGWDEATPNPSVPAQETMNDECRMMNEKKRLKA
jgi:hypothetical protein